MDALRTRLMDPDLVAEFLREFTAEWNCLSAERSAGRAAQERELASVTRKLDVFYRRYGGRVPGATVAGATR